MDVILVDESGNNIGKVTIEEAEAKAAEAGKDLVMVNAKNQVYRIADAGKLKYEQKQRERAKRAQQKAQQRAHKVKEIKLTPGIGDHDLEYKTKHIREFLEKGLKTKVTMTFKGRHKRNLAMFHATGRDRIEEVINTLVEEGVAKVDSEIKSEGINLTVFLIPEKGQ